jgi:hypothetical protein
VITTTGEFRSRYVAALEAYLRDHDEAALKRAYELGRAAVAEEMGVLDLATLHHDAIASSLPADSDPERVRSLVHAAGEFFAESISAFEMVRRILQGAREAAMVEQRQAAVLRRLSSFLTDATLALDAAGSLEEMLQLVAEHACELIGAGWCSLQLTQWEGEHATEAFARSEERAKGEGRPDANGFAALYSTIAPETGSVRMSGAEIAARSTGGGAGPLATEGWLAASLTALDGRPFGLIQLFDGEHGRFSELDEAMLVQVAQMASAAVERARVYER